jgi:hypothetical protein
MKRSLDRCLAALGAAVLLTGAAAPVAPAPMSVGELLKRHIIARGGADRWRAVTSLEITGTHTSFSTPHPFTLLRSRPNLYRMDRTMLRQPVIEVFDGQKPWWINGLLGNTWPLPVPPPFDEVTRREAVFETPLMAPADGGHKVELMGLEDFEGKPAYKLKVTLGAAEETWYLDPATSLEVARISKTVDFFEEMEKRSYFSDFRSEAGLVMPHRIDMEYGTRNEVFEITRVIANAAIEPDRFRMPPPEGMGPLQSLAGQWDLKIETRPGPRAPWVAEKAASSIVLRLDGGLIEEHYSHVDQGFPVELVRTISYDRFGKTYRVTSTDNFSFQQNVMEGTMADGRLTASNEKTGTAQTAPPDRTVHSRIILADILPDSFRIDLESSTDAGKTWNTDARYTYTRR